MPWRSFRVLVMAGMAAVPVQCSAADNPTPGSSEAVLVAFQFEAGRQDPDGLMMLGMIGPWLDRGANPIHPLEAVAELDGEVGNGGFSQYFLNSSWDDWQLALAGMALLHDDDGAALAHAAGSVLGPTGPAAAQGGRQQQLVALSPAQNATLNDLDRKWYSHQDKLGALFLQYLRGLHDAKAFLRRLPPTAFDLEGRSPQGADADWGKPLVDAFANDKRLRKTEILASKSALDLNRDDFMYGYRDELHVVILDAKDANCAGHLAAAAIMAPASNLLCVVIGPLPAGVSTPAAADLQVFPDMAAAAAGLPAVVAKRLVPAKD